LRKFETPALSLTLAVFIAIRAVAPVREQLDCTAPSIGCVFLLEVFFIQTKQASLETKVLCSKKLKCCTRSRALLNFVRLPNVPFTGTLGG
jgi:hypothetical protein